MKPATVVPIHKEHEETVDDDERMILIQSYAKRLHDGINFHYNARRYIERMSFLVSELEKMGWFD